MSEDTKIRNYLVDDALNKDWCKLLLRLQEKKEEQSEQAVEEGEAMEELVEDVEVKSAPTLLQRIKAGLLGLAESIEQWGKKDEDAVPAPIEQDAAEEDENEGETMPEEIIEEVKATYQVQPFHANFAKADEKAKWSFSSADGNAILDKGGWALYKQVHLVTDTSEGATPEKKSAYTYPVAKLVDGKPTYFLKSAQTVYGGLRGGARGAKLPEATNDKVLATVKRIYKAFGRDTEKMGLKAFFYTDDEGRTRFAGGPGGGGGSSGGGAGGESAVDVSQQGDINAFRFVGEATDAAARQRLESARNTATELNKVGEFNGVRAGDSVKYNSIYGPGSGTVERIEYSVGDFQFPTLATVVVKGADGNVSTLGPLSLNAMRYYGIGKQEKSLKSSTAFAFKAADGADWWMQWTTNAYQDREGEYFQTKALEEFVERHRGEKIKGEFWYRHIPGTKFGDVHWQAMEGRFLVQAGPFDDTPVGNAFKEFFKSHPDGHADIAPEGWGTSHGYQYNASDRKDGVYEWVEIKESTVLPRSAASNPWSPFPRIIQRSTEMNDKERQELEKIGGKALVDLVTKEGEQRTKELEGMGVGYKSLSGAMAKVMALMDAVEDADIKAALSEIYDELQSPEEGEAEMVETEAEMEVPEELAALAEGEMAMAEAEAGKPDASCKEAEDEKEAEPKVDTASKSEVADALTLLTTQLRAEIKASQKETADTVTASIAETIKPLVDIVTELKKSDGEKIAEKAASTPAASLREMVQSVLDRKEARVDDGELKLFGKPQETAAAQRPEGGMPSFIAGMFTQ